MKGDHMPSPGTSDPYGQVYDYASAARSALGTAMVAIHAIMSRTAGDQDIALASARMWIDSLRLTGDELCTLVAAATTLLAQTWHTGTSSLGTAPPDVAVGIRRAAEYVRTHPAAGTVIERELLAGLAVELHLLADDVPRPLA